MGMQSPHRDVLDANPDSEDSKVRLIEELQNRGRAAVGAKSWMDAKLLYEKAVTVCPSGDPKVAILNSNLSLVHKNMGSFEDARQCAQKATEADPGYLKAWWQLSQALQSLHRSQEALSALDKAKQIEPTNKAVIKEYGKVQKKVEEEAKLMKETPPEVENPAAETKTMAKTKTKATNSKPKTTATTAASKKEDKMDVDDEKIFSKSDAVRGYKVVNGKKTSYFHNELSAEAKELIGDIAPKKLDTPAPLPSSASTGGASVWNKAGTWEEKDTTKWATESLEKQIMQTTYFFPESSPAPGSLVTVTKVSKLDGHASFAQVRGKKRYIYEFLVKLEWKVSNDSGLECSGTLAIPDIDGTIDLGEGYEIHEFSIDSVSDNNVKPLLDRFVHRGGFHEALNESIDDWVRLFKKEY